jgi:hypothetical protein
MPIEQERRQFKAARWCETELDLGSEECGGQDVWPEANTTLPTWIYHDILKYN